MATETHIPSLLSLEYLEILSVVNSQLLPHVVKAECDGCALGKTYNIYRNKIALSSFASEFPHIG